jgi:ADP-ribose pyrophosphatase YjhB (NUDIX family)
MPHHYQDADRQNPTTPADRLPTALYSQALDHLVIACIDILLTHQSQIFLAKRKSPPRPSWWIIGGRMAAGEAPLAAAHRKLLEEVGLDIAPDRLLYIGVYSTCFSTRQQPPQQNGLHSLNLTYQVELTADEKAALNLSATEYLEGEWMSSDRMTGLLDMAIVMDQALLQIIRDAKNTHPQN